MLAGGSAPIMKGLGRVSLTTPGAVLMGRGARGAMAKFIVMRGVGGRQCPNGSEFVRDLSTLRAAKSRLAGALPVARLGGVG